MTGIQMDKLTIENTRKVWILDAMGATERVLHPYDRSGVTIYFQGDTLTVHVGNQQGNWGDA